MGILLPQTAGKEVEVLTDNRSSIVSTGQKRNDLIARAQGDYVSFIDDDDFVTDDYVFWLLSGIEKEPDVVTMKGFMTTNGGARVEWIIKLGERYEARKDADGITRYYRFPNHLCAMKKSKIINFKFPHKWHGEDYEFALKIHESGVLKSEAHIDKQLYHYDFSTKK